MISLAQVYPRYLAFMKTSNRVSMLGRLRQRLSNLRQATELPGKDAMERGALFKDFLASLNADANDGTSAAPARLTAACASVVDALMNQSGHLHLNRLIPGLVAAYT